MGFSWATLARTCASEPPYPKRRSVGRWGRSWGGMIHWHAPPVAAPIWDTKWDFCRACFAAARGLEGRWALEAEARLPGANPPKVWVGPTSPSRNRSTSSVGFNGIPRKMEAPTGFEPVNGDFANLCLTTWPRRRCRVDLAPWPRIVQVQEGHRPGVADGIRYLGCKSAGDCGRIRASNTQTVCTAWLWGVGMKGRA